MKTHQKTISYPSAILSIEENAKYYNAKRLYLSVRKTYSTKKLLVPN